MDGSELSMSKISLLYRYGKRRVAMRVTIATDIDQAHSAIHVQRLDSVATEEDGEA